MTHTNWSPSQDDIDEMLDLYESWLNDARNVHPTQEDAINAVMVSFQENPNQVFDWIAQNKPDLIYDVDEKFPELS
jgi:hypothetical protein